MTQKERFFVEWMVLNPIGFTLGSLHGATDNGFVPSVITGYLGLILGDILFGGMVGFSQYIVFRRTDFLPASIQWIVANSIGFTLGARLGALLTFRITDDWMLAGVIFGVFMGGSIGLATGFVIYKSITTKRLLIWIIISVAAWVLGETIAFLSLFSLKTVPLVALAIAATTGAGLIFLKREAKSEMQNQAEGP